MRVGCACQWCTHAEKERVGHTNVLPPGPPPLLPPKEGGQEKKRNARQCVHKWEHEHNVHIGYAPTSATRRTIGSERTHKHSLASVQMRVAMVAGLGPLRHLLHRREHRPATEGLTT